MLALLVALTGWYVFRGLVRMAFIFDASAVISFLLAPVLLPLAALPAACFWLALRFVPRVWGDASLSPTRKTLNTFATVPAAALLAAFLDRIETLFLLSIGLRLPSLLFNTF